MTIGTIDEVSEQVVWEAAMRALARVRVLTVAELITEAGAHGGDIVIKSKDAEVVIACVEGELGGDALVDQSHLGRSEKTSLRSLTRLLWRRSREVTDPSAAR